MHHRDHRDHRGKANPGVFRANGCNFPDNLHSFRLPSVVSVLSVVSVFPL